MTTELTGSSLRDRQIDGEANCKLTADALATEQSKLDGRCSKKKRKVSKWMKGETLVRDEQMICKDTNRFYLESDIVC